MGRLSSALIGATALLAVAAAPSSAAGLKAEVIHWWTSPGESVAVKVFADAFNKAGGEWVDTAIAMGQNSRAACVTRIVGGNPAAACQFSTGKQFDDLVAKGLLSDLDDVAAEQHWKDVIPKAFLDAVTVNGHIYAEPVNNHGQSWLWYNKAIFAKLNLPEPQTYEDFWSDAKKLKEAGYVPLALGAQSWQFRFLFNQLVLGVAGQDVYYKVYRDHDINAIRSPAFRQVIETLAKFRDDVDPGSANRNWNDAANLLITNKAGMHFMGDWEKGEFLGAKWVAGKDYGCVLGPGDHSFILGGDVFIYPKTKDAEQAKAQKLMARTLLTQDVQLAFNEKKGSLPVRLDVDTTKLDACAQIGVKAMNDAKLQVPTTDMLVSGDLNGSIGDLVADFWTKPNMTADDLAGKIADAFKAED